MGAPANLNQGWNAHLHLRFARSTSKTKMVERHRAGPLSVQRGFYPEGPVCHSYVLHPPGGVVAGDRLDIRCHLESDAQAVITTPGATKFYRSLGATAYQSQHLRVDDGASLEWLPQENIFFDGAQVWLDTDIQLAPNARFIGWEFQCAGRPVMDEAFVKGHVQGRFNLFRDSRRLLSENMQLGAAHNAASHRDQALQATMIATPAQSDDLAITRDVINAHVADRQEAPSMAATLMDQVLVVRALGHTTDDVMTCFTAIWHAIRPSIIGRPASPPRIWNT